MSLPFSLGFLLLPLLGGYLFLKIFNPTRFYFRSVEGQALFFASASIGVLLLALSEVAVVEFWQIWPGPGLRGGLKRYAPFPHSGAAFGALLLGIGGAALLDCIFWPKWTNKFIAKRTDDLLYLLLDVQHQKQSLLLTLENGKAYAGYILDVSKLRLWSPYVKILPTVSGYRTKDELHLELVTIYEESEGLVKRLHNGLATTEDIRLLERLQIVLRREDVFSASFFNEDLYKRHFQLRQEAQQAASAEQEPGVSFDLTLPGGLKLKLAIQRPTQQA